MCENIDLEIAHKVLGLDIDSDCCLPYSTDIKLAFSVIEKFLPYFRLECNENSEFDDDCDKDKPWHCDVWVEGGLACVSAETASLAMCKAALRATEILEEKFGVSPEEVREGMAQIERGEGIDLEDLE